MPAANRLLAFLFAVMERDSLIKIGYVMKTHGLKGEVTLSLSPDAPKIDVQDVLVVEQKSGIVPYFVECISVMGTKALVKLVDINSIDLSFHLKGCSVFMEKSKRPKLKRGEFYDDELVGFEVVDKKNGKLGRVIQVVNQGSNRLLEVTENGILIPLNGPFITSISKSKKEIGVELPKGFLDI